MWCAPARAQRVDSITGSVQVVQVDIKSAPSPRTLRIYLPPGYEREGKRRYPVLYLQDGQNLFSGKTSFLPNGEWRVDEAAQSLIEAGLIEPVIIVGIDNAGARRDEEYLPTRAKVDGEELGGEADAYGKLLVEELKPYVDRTYRTKTDARNTAIGGSSLGGVVSLYLGLTYPKVFGKLAIVSPSLWWDDELMLRQTEERAQRSRQVVWLDTGTDEGSNGAATVERVRKLGAIFEKKGWRAGKDLAVYVDGYAIHREDAWARRMPAILLFLFGKK